MGNVTVLELRHLTHRQLVMFSLFCAHQLKSVWKGDWQVLDRIPIIERWLKGEATIEECTNAMPGMAYMAVVYYTFSAIVFPDEAVNVCVCAGLAVSTHVLHIKRKGFDKHSANEDRIQAQREWLKQYSEAHIVKEVLKIPER